MVGLSPVLTLSDHSDKNEFDRFKEGTVHQIKILNL